MARALDRKDAAAVARHGGELAPVLTELLLAAGPADRALAALRGCAAAVRCARPGRPGWPATVAAIRARAPDLAPDHRSGGVPRLSLRDRGVGHRLRARPARGARPRRSLHLWRCGAGDRPDLVSRMRSCGSRRRARLASGCTSRSAPIKPRRCRCAVLGYATVAALETDGDAAAEARRLLCSHILRDGSAVPLTTDN